MRSPFYLMRDLPVSKNAMLLYPTHGHLDLDTRFPDLTDLLWALEVKMFLGFSAESMTVSV